MSNLEGFSGGADYVNDVHIKLLKSLSIRQYCRQCIVLHF